MAENIIVSQDNLTISIPEDSNVYALFLKESGDGSFQLVETTSNEKFGFEWTFNSLPPKGAAAAIIQYDEEPENPAFDSSKTYATVTFQYSVKLTLDIPANGLYVGETLGYNVEPSTATLTFSEEIFTDGVLTQLPQNDVTVTASADGYESVTSEINKNLLKQHELKAVFNPATFSFGDTVSLSVTDESGNEITDANWVVPTGYASISKNEGYSFTILTSSSSNSLKVDISKDNYKSTSLTQTIRKLSTSINIPASITYPSNITFSETNKVNGVFKIDNTTKTSPIKNYQFDEYANKTITFTPTNSVVYNPSTATINLVSQPIEIDDLQVSCFDEVEIESNVPNFLQLTLSCDDIGFSIENRKIIFTSISGQFTFTAQAAGFEETTFKIDVSPKQFNLENFKKDYFCGELIRFDDLSESPEKFIVINGVQFYNDNFILYKDGIYNCTIFQDGFAETEIEIKVWDVTFQQEKIKLGQSFNIKDFIFLSCCTQTQLLTEITPTITGNSIKISNGQIKTQNIGSSTISIVLNDISFKKSIFVTADIRVDMSLNYISKAQPTTFKAYYLDLSTNIRTDINANWTILGKDVTKQDTSDGISVSTTSESGTAIIIASYDGLNNKEIELPILKNLDEVSNKIDALQTSYNEILAKLTALEFSLNNYSKIEDVSRLRLWAVNLSDYFKLANPINLQVSDYERISLFLNSCTFDSYPSTFDASYYTWLNVDDSTRFANFRNLPNLTKTFRGASPINDAKGRAAIASQLIQNNIIDTVLNLESDITTGYPTSVKQVICANLDGADLNSANNKALLSTALISLSSKNITKLYIHCTEGKWRAGFVSTLLECLKGMTYDEIESDFMESYFNYYGISKVEDINVYNTAVEWWFKYILRCIFEGANQEFDYEIRYDSTRLKDVSTEYLIALGLSTTQINNLVSKVN